MVKEEDRSIIERIKQLRQANSLSQASFAKLIDVSSGNVGQWERYVTLPSASALKSIALKLGCSVDWLLFGSRSNKTCPPFTEKKAEIITDPDLARMIAVLKEIMNDPDPRRRTWAVMQFEDAFKQYCSAFDEKKLRA
jgi:phage transcriptional regulator